MWANGGVHPLCATDPSSVRRRLGETHVSQHRNMRVPIPAHLERHKPRWGGLGLGFLPHDHRPRANPAAFDRCCQRQLPQPLAIGRVEEDQGGRRAGLRPEFGRILR